MLEINGLSYTYADGTQALIQVSLTIPEAHAFAIMGISGSGKTTLLNCMARFLIPQQGTILLDGQDSRQLTEQAFRQQVGVVFQKLNLFPHMTVLENMVLAPCRTQQRNQAEVRDAAHDMLERLAIAGFRDNYPAQLSGGQAQRVAIARGLMLKPKLMLLDEPTSALDAKTTTEFGDWLRELKSDTTFVIVTHDIPFAQYVASQGVYMADGRIQAHGPIKNILTTI